MFYYKRNTENEKSRWHEWFAWHPVTVEITPDGDQKCIGWEWVYRCGKLSRPIEGDWWTWEYSLNPRQ